MAERPGARLMLAAALGAALAWPQSGALAAMTGEQVRDHVARTLGVRVLNVREGEVDGRAAFIVTVMNPGGDFNEAFQVNRLAVDAETGDLIPAFRDRASGYDGSGGGSRTSTPEPTDTMRPSPRGTR
ncbi:MAG: hypothetical protein GEU92_09600 [Alphaproteobacteria bacterium]|nr:hypothetical protein [Alphaproteobacteria bacterium]